MSHVFVGVDIGGTGTRLVSYMSDRVVASFSLDTAELCLDGSDYIVSRLARLVSDLVPAGAKLAGLGIGASGPVDPIRGTINNPDTLAAFHGVSLVHELELLCGAPVLLENDAMAAAIAEHSVGAGRGVSRMLLVTLGTGVGVALVVDGVPFRGANDMHPEASHFPIRDDGKPCYCGLAGCWEQLASRSALQRTLLGCFPEVDDRVILPFSVARYRDAPVHAVFDEYGGLLARGLLTLQSVYMPELIVIGGSAAQYFDVIEPGVSRFIRHSRQLGGALCIKASSLGDEAGAVGAAILAKNLVVPRTKFS